jgi:hypothetical protein
VTISHEQNRSAVTTSREEQTLELLDRAVKINILNTLDLDTELLPENQ